MPQLNGEPPANVTHLDPARDGRDRPPLPLETSRPCVFAAGDLRCGSVERVASAVGDGATAVRISTSTWPYWRERAMNRVSRT